MDDKAGRRMAKNFGVASIGTVGVLVLAKQKHGLAAIKPLLDQLTQSGYFLGDKLMTDALVAAGECYSNRDSKCRFLNDLKVVCESGGE